MVYLESAYDNTSSVNVLYDLLAERTPEQSISHKRMPTFQEHKDFFSSKPYKYWGIILISRIDVVGSIYLTDNREVGIFIFKEYQGKGYATQAVEELRKMYPGKLLANVNPMNKPSRDLFEKLGGKMIQVTYILE